MKEKQFIDEAKPKSELLEKASRIVRNGVVKFMDYMAGLKQNEPALLDNPLSDYEISSSIHSAKHISNINPIDFIV